MSNSSIWLIYRTLSGATSPDQSGLGSHSNEEVLHIPQSSNATGASWSDSFVSYLGHSLGESYAAAEMQSVYSTAQADCATGKKSHFFSDNTQPLLIELKNNSNFSLNICADEFNTKVRSVLQI